MTGPSQHSAATRPDTGAGPLATARRRRAELLATIQTFEAALAVPAGDPTWRERVADRLRLLADAIGEHVVVTEGPDGLYAELLEHAPRLVHGAQSLVREHAALLATVEALRSRVLTADIDRLRRWSSDLLRELARHRQHGADLVYEAYATDIGGET